MFTHFSRRFFKLFNRFFGDHFDEKGFISYTNNIQWFSVAKVFSLGISFVTTMIVARLLGPSAFGMLNYVISIVGLFAVVANLGIGNVVYKELVLHKDRREVILGSAFFLNFITACAALVLVGFGFTLLHETWYVKSLIVLMSLSFFTQPLSLLSFDFLKDAEGKYVTIAQTTTLFISSLFKISVVYFFNSLPLFIIALVLESALSGLIYAYQIMHIKRRSLNLHIEKKQVLLLFSMALPLLLYSAFSEIYARIDQVMLKHYLDTAAVGLYAAAVRLTEIWYLVPNILATALFPALANVKDNNYEYNKRLGMLFKTFTGAALVISIFVFFTKDILIEIIYGKDFSLASPILGIYIFSLIGFFLSLLIYQDLFIRHNNKWLIACIPFLTAILNIALNIILIPLYGPLGAAIATTVSYDIVPIMFYIWKRF